jgi:hypothetical protein
VTVVELVDLVVTARDIDAGSRVELADRGGTVLLSLPPEEAAVAGCVAGHHRRYRQRRPGPVAHTRCRKGAPGGASWTAQPG